MADTKSSKEAKPEEVTLTNVSRRPLLIRLPGQTLRLGPGERQIVAKSMLATTEVLRMCEQRFVAVTPISEAELEVPPTKPKATTPPSEETSELPVSPEKKPELEEGVAEEAAAEDTVAEETVAEDVAAEGTQPDSAGLNPKTPAVVDTASPKPREGKKASEGKTSFPKREENLS